MKRKLLLSLLPFAAIALFTSEKMSDNGRAGYTASPGEQSCTSCHSSFTLNSGGGSVTIQSPGMAGWTYTPGQTYTMSVTVNRTGNALFGVGIEALTSANDNAGMLNVTDAASTQIKTRTVNTVVRRNVVHQLNGGAASGSKVFNFSWTAPAAGTGNVTFYFAGVAANGNGSESSDYVYTGSQVITELTCQTPATPGIITGNAAVCPNSTNLFYVDTVPGATSYSWNLPPGCSGSSTTNVINVTCGSSSGTISVTANNGCGNSAPRTFNLTVTSINSQVITNNITCSGAGNGTATVSPTGGSTPYNFSWSPSGGSAASASGLTAGTYTVTISDGSGCVSTATAVIHDPAVVIASTVSSITMCEGEAQVIGGSPSGSGGTGTLTYQWTPATGLNTPTSANPTLTGVSSNVYTLTVTDANNCSASASTNVTVNMAPVAGLQVSGDTLYASGGTSYQWYLNNSYFTNPHDTYWVPLQNGTYYVMATVGACQGTSSSLLYASLGLDEMQHENSIRLYPNPADNAVTINIPGITGKASCSIFDATGRVVLQKEFRENETIDVSLLSKGIYSVQISTTGKAYHSRLNIER